ncbi:glycosyltransferase [Dongia sp.]|uniref:glycosyltransferase family 2 protein n=1 Tax=Dongia sp. TaxID=1977262 RepID=UPI0035B372B7
MAAPRICAIVPSHNHARAMPEIIRALRAQQLAIFIVDDGSNEAVRHELASLNDPPNEVIVVRLEPNQGKGGAVLHGFQLAMAAGFTHALQIDADGQHDVAAIPRLIALAVEQPDALITGVPIYDRSVPLGRAIGRYVTHLWVWIETLSLQISDSMCGLRVYPLAPVAALCADGERIGLRMDFDTEIMVRLFWRGVPVVEEPVAVTYPAGNISNFDLRHDNLRISAMHSRLFFGMMRRFPAILRSRPHHRRHWAKIAERGVYWGLEGWALAARLLGRRGCLAIMAPVVLYFYLTGWEQRRASHDFLRRAAAHGAPLSANRLWLSGFIHFMSFAGRAVDTFLGWTGGISDNAVQPGMIVDLAEAERSAAGALFIVAHLGNVDLARALLDERSRQRLLVLVHTRHAEKYNRLLRKYRPEAGVNIWQVTELGPAAAMELQARVEQGAWIVIAGDRVPVKSERVTRLPFLGQDAPFSQGPYVLGALLGCPVYTLFCTRRGDRHVLDVEKIADRIDLPRQDREAALSRHVGEFAARLEAYAVANPLQWYNFFDFWNPGRRESRS